MKTPILVVAFAASMAMAATSLSDLPNLSTATDKTTSSASSASATSDSSSGSASASSTAAASSSGASSSAASSSGSSSSTSGTASKTSSSSVSHLSNLPTIAGATVPTIVIPYTADAPFMQKSSLPEGTVFICIGAILAFLGLCILAWRAIIAYSINRSVKRAALASIMASDAKAPSWLQNRGPSKKGPGGNMYEQPGHVSALSLDALTASGKKADPYQSSRRVTAGPTRKEQKRDPSGLFFSPTAAAVGGANPPPMSGLNSANRASTYLPAGYYAAPSAQTAGGAPSTTLGGGRRPASYSRHTPPESPNMPPHGSNLRAPSGRDDSRNRASWATNSFNRNSAPLLSPTYAPQHSTSSLVVGIGHGEENLPGSRAPSAYFDDVLENHGNGPRER